MPIMIDRPKFDAAARKPDDDAGNAAMPVDEAEHARRNALQIELLRGPDSRARHRTFIDQALRRVRKQDLRRPARDGAPRDR